MSTMATPAANNVAVPASTTSAVFVASEALPEDTPIIKGHDFDQSTDANDVLQSMLTMGFQGTCFGQAIDEVNRMLNWRLSHEPLQPDEEAEENPSVSGRENIRTKIFLGYTSNLVSAGVREQLRWLVQHKMVDVLVTTAGGIEEDFIKCLAPTYMGDFSYKGADLRRRGLNRIGNMLVPNDNYCKFEDWIMPILDTMLQEQQQQGVLWTPSTVIKRLGLEINNPSSVYYWAAKNDIPVYCPAITDGSIGDMLFFHSYKSSPGLVVDLVQDIRAMNQEAIKAAPRKTGMIILGGGVPKHHICNANLMRNGADFAVYINTAQEFDGSDSGAKPDEAVSWGKIRMDARPVKVCADATIVFPLLVSQTFAKAFAKRKESKGAKGRFVSL